MRGKSVDYNLSRSIYDFFDEQIIQNESLLNKTAIIYKSKSLTFRQVQDLITKINQFIYSSIDFEQKNCFIDVHLIPDEYTIPVLLAINSLSCGYFLYHAIDPQLPFESALALVIINVFFQTKNKGIKYMINDAKPRLIITNSNDTKIKQIIGENQNVKLFNLNDILINDNGSDIIIPNTNSKKNVACVLYTSGSTGLPKGVLLSNESIMNRLFWQWDEFRLDETDIGAFKTSMNFVDHIAEIFAFILKGLPIVVIDPEITSSSINALIDTLYDYKVTYFVLVPSLLRNIIIYTKDTKNYFKLNHIKRYVCSGEKLTRDLLDLFFEVTSDLKIKPVISNFYGSTEVTADITFITFKSKEQVEKLVLSKSDVPIGVPISNSRVYLFDENMQIIDTEDKIGEIYAGGKCLANGYLKNENETNKFVTINNEYLFKTGDFGYFHDSLLYYSGRADSQIKINGKRVDLAELEFHSTKIKEIKSLVPLVYNDFPIAFYESDSDLSTEILNEIIIGHLKDCVYEHMIPNIHNLIRIESMPLLYNGKIDKQKLMGIYKDKNPALQNRNTKIESKNFAKKVLDIIQKITGIIVKNSSCDLSFDKLGINSLNYVEIYFELNEILHKKISFDQFLSIKSVNELLDQSAEKNLGKSIYRIIKFSENESLAFEVLNMFVGTFNDRNIIHSTFPIESTEKNLYDCFHPMVEYLKSSDKCFVVFDVTKQKYVGGCFIYDYDDNPPFTIVNEFFFHLLELLDLVAKMAADKEKLRNKKILYSAIVTTSPETSQEENVMIINFIEENIINIGREFDFDAILTTNTSKLTQDMNLMMNEYVLEDEFRINNYEHNGQRYFSTIDDSHTITACVKYLKNV